MPFVLPRYPRSSVVGPGISLILCALLVICSCTPDDASQTIGDIQAVVEQAGITVSILQSASAKNPRDKAEELAALSFAEAASRAAWLSVSESNSKDSISEKNEKITGYFTKVPLLSPDQFSNQNVKVGEEQLTGSIKLLLGRLQSSRSAMADHPGIGDIVPRSIPQTLTSHLNEIRQGAIDNITAANLLIERLQH